MQEGNKSLCMLQNVQFGREIFTSSTAALVGKRPISCSFRFGRQRIHQEKNEAIRIARKHDNSLKTFSSAIQKHLAMHQFDFILQILS